MCLFIGVAVMVVIIVTHVKKTGAQRIQPDTQATAESAKTMVTDAVKAGTKAADEVATDVVAVTQEGVRKADALATNVAAEAKVMTTNVVGKVARAATNVLDQAQQKFDVITH
jgi:hypothetical protein